ncbi:hypothetical protein VP01_1435g2 [Puccinia sorghi]|uniref:Uncharacterized protein n=1 Tax=Puccinia sorghi TaxID=27349 RepID=A0A0L6VKA7_9BASI|nr:hypothetical protein VP01_1435g2 [Puccinia sorghi]
MKFVIVVRFQEELGQDRRRFISNNPQFHGELFTKALESSTCNKDQIQRVAIELTPAYMCVSAYEIKFLEFHSRKHLIKKKGINIFLPSSWGCWVVILYPISKCGLVYFFTLLLLQDHYPFHQESFLGTCIVVSVMKSARGPFVPFTAMAILPETLFSKVKSLRIKSCKLIYCFILFEEFLFLNLWSCIFRKIRIWKFMRNENKMTIRKNEISDKYKHKIGNKKGKNRILKTLPVAGGKWSCGWVCRSFSIYCISMWKRSAELSRVKQIDKSLKLEYTDYISGLSQQGAVKREFLLTGLRCFSLLVILVLHIETKDFLRSMENNSQCHRQLFFPHQCGFPLLLECQKHISEWTGHSGGEYVFITEFMVLLGVIVLENQKEGILILRGGRMNGWEERPKPSNPGNICRCMQGCKAFIAFNISSCGQHINIYRGIQGCTAFILLCIECLVEACGKHRNKGNWLNSLKENSHCLNEQEYNITSFNGSFPRHRSTDDMILQCFYSKSNHHKGFSRNPLKNYSVHVTPGQIKSENETMKLIFWRILFNSKPFKNYLWHILCKFPQSKCRAKPFHPDSWIGCRRNKICKRSILKLALENTSAKNLPRHQNCALIQLTGISVSRQDSTRDTTFYHVLILILDLKKGSLTCDPHKLKV